MMHKKLIRVVALIVLVVFTVTNALPTQEIAYAMSKDNKSTKSDIEYQTPSTLTKLGSFSDELYTWYEKLKIDLDNGDLPKFKSDLKNVKNDLKDIRKDISNELSENEKTLNKLNAKNAEDRHKKFVTSLDNKLDGFDTLFDKLDEVTATLKYLKGKDSDSLKVKVDEIGNLLQPEQPQQPLGTLPHNNISVNPPVPATGAGTSAAYMVSTTGTAVPELPKTPSAEDLAETAEVKFTQEIKDLTDNLNNSVQIYEYVKNNIDYETYYGSRKGAEGTLQQMSGNDFDQASLLISMLRYKGIPARYIRGTVDIPIETVMGWTGAKDPETAVKILGSLGNPTISLVSGGKISSVRTEHVWVEAYITYENYRGVGQGKGKNIWVPLDPSFKQYNICEGLDVNNIIGLDAVDTEPILKEDTIKSQEDNAVLRVDVSSLSNIFDNAETKFEKYLIDNNLNQGSIEDVFGGKKIKPEKLGLLPLTLPYKVNNVSAELREIPLELSEAVTFSIKGSSPYLLNFSGEEYFTYNARTSDLYGKRITLSWAPASSEDEEIINYYGGIFKVPVYMVSMKPQLKIDNIIVAEGSAVGLGYSQDFKMAMKGVGIPEETVENPVTVGGMYNVGLDYGCVSAAEIKKIQQNIEELKTTININNIYTDNAMGEILNATAKAYFAQIDLYDHVLTGQYKVSSNRLLSEAITGYNPQIKYMFMSPVEINEGSMYIDVDRDVRSAVSIDGNNDSVKGYMLASGMFGSAMEHRIFEQMTGTPSVSTIKIFEVANTKGIPLYNIDKSNINEILPKLEISRSVKTDIMNAVNSDKIVMIPQRNIQYFDWNGVGYIVLDPETGAAGYMISGGIAGGSMAVKEVLERYVEYVVTGIISMLMFDVVEMLLLAFLPGGCVVGIMWGIGLTAMGFGIYNMFHLYQQYKTTGEVRYLQEILIQIAAICTLGVIRSGPLKDLFEETASLKFIIREMKTLGYSTETTLSFLMTYGLGRFTQAKTTMITFAKYGITENQLFDISQNFDRYNITKIETTYVKAGILSSQDYDIIAILFKQVGTTSSADSLSTSIVTLANANIVPSTYSIYGIAGINGVNFAVNAISNGITSVAMKQLADVGIKTTDYEQYGITTQAGAEAVAEAISVARAAGIVEAEIPAFIEFLTRAAGQFGDTSNVIKAFKYLSSGDFTSFANMLDLSTPAGKAVFWSGDKAAAIRYAESIGGNALETTPGGKLLNDWTWLSQKFPTWAEGVSTDQRPLWEAVSEKYSEIVEGPVTVVRPGGEAGTGGYVWTNVEYPTLRARNIEINYVNSVDVY